jgi:hypothetical protein
MKKLIVVEEKTESAQIYSISEFLGMQYNYGLYDFDVEKIIEDLKNLHELTLVDVQIPYYTLLDKNSKSVTLEFVDEYVP